MNLFKNMFRSVSQRSSKTRRLPNRLRARLLLEGLETRLVPASVFVVPSIQAADVSHFHTLGAALMAAGSNGVVTIEPGASPDAFPTPLPVNLAGITIQGDPNVPASILPAYQLSVQANSVTLANLNLGSLVVGVDAAVSTVTGINVHNCLINTLTAFDSNSSYSQNIITDSATFQDDDGEVISNNTFTSSAETLLNLDSSSGTSVSQNTFTASDIAALVIKVHNSHSALVGSGHFFRFSPTSIANNTITSPGSQFTDGIEVIQDAAGASDVRIVNNRIDTNGGLIMDMDTGDDAHFRAYVEGNDFHNNRVGVSVIGDGVNVGTVDMGGGSLGSQGGNNFRGFALPTGLSQAAIEVTNASGGTVVAEKNIFSNDVTPSDVTFSGPGGGSTDVANPLSSQRASVQALYNEVLGRTGSVSELDGWVSILSTQGQAAVVNGILRSPESLGRIVDAFYLRFLGRQSDANGRTSWVSFLQHGGTEEQLENAFLTSPEYLGHINTDFVQSLYINILGRTGSAGEVAGWNDLIQQLGFAGIANGFIESAENRAITLDTYFQTFLHRAPTTTESNTFVNSSADLLTMEGLVLSLPEYFTNG